MVGCWGWFEVGVEWRHGFFAEDAEFWGLVAVQDTEFSDGGAALDAVDFHPHGFKGLDRVVRCRV